MTEFGRSRSYTRRLYKLSLKDGSRPKCDLHFSSHLQEPFVRNPGILSNDFTLLCCVELLTKLCISLIKIPLPFLA